MLTPQALDRLLTEAIKRQRAADSLLSIAECVATAGVEPMPMDEIDTEVKAACQDARRRFVPVVFAPWAQVPNLARASEATR